MTTPKYPSSFKPLKRVENPLEDPPEPGAICVEDVNGIRSWITHAESDARDGITPADLDFHKG